MNTGSFLEFFVLKMLSSEPHYLRQIHHRLQTIGFKTPLGSLYPLFSAFRQKGFTTNGYEEFDDGVQKTYCLTEKGRQRLIDLKRDWKHLDSIINGL